jgi:hypothetical protein
MNLGWLGNIFGSLLHVFSPLKAIAHWKIWAELKTWYDRFKKWRDWYKQHVLAPMQKMRKMQQDLYNQFFRPLLKVVDDLRRITSIVGIFNRKLANKLNYQFLRVESYLLAPLNKITSRVNGLGRALTGIVTPLGYLDRATLLNSVWRDAALIKEILHNPYEQHPAAATLPAGPTISDRVGWTLEYAGSGSGPYAADVDAGVANYQTLRAQS